MSDEFKYVVKRVPVDPDFMEAARGMIEMDMGYEPGTLPPYEPPDDPEVGAALDKIRKEDERRFFGISP